MSVRSIRQFWEDLTDYDELIMFGAVFLVTLYLIVETYSYAWGARLIPMMVLVVLAFLLAIRLVLIGLSIADIEPIGLLPPSVRERLEGGGESFIDEVLEEDEPPLPADQIRGIVWVLIITATLYLFGIYWTVPVLLFLFIYVESEMSLLWNVIIVALFSGSLYLLFIHVLNIRLYHGIYEIPLPGIL